ncbi:MAG: TetR/AcrR family transcriptional regulator C-terminal domain-containing protein [Salaquimonas sp.]|jgi:TetR/AcrR family tetracycline transcriptional repressor|nr:TetR/AcrR family transcriptional regulator C-terminal domain-containing protein [Salaquimonas sp.]
MALTRDEVVAAAIRLLDEEGLSGLTLRRLAKELGISAPTLYWHVKDKRELLDLMAERIIAEHRVKQPPLPDDMTWWQKVTELCRRQYFAMIAHRDGAQVVAGNRPTERMLPMIDRWIGIWIQAGIPPEEALALILAVGNYIIGSALEYQAEADRTKVRGDIVAISQAGKEQHPNLMNAINCRGSKPRDPHAIFEYGLTLLIAGIRARFPDLANGEGKDVASGTKTKGKALANR